MFDGVILGDACLIVMSSTRRLQAITGNAGFPSSPHGCLDCDRPPRCRDRKACCPTFFGVDIQSTSLRKFISSAELFRFGDDGFFRGGYHNVIVVFSPYRGSTVVAAASSATLTVVSCADAIPNGDSANILAIDIAIIFVFDIHTVLLWTLPDNCLS